MVAHSSDEDLFNKTVRTEDSPIESLLVKYWIAWAVLDGCFGLFSLTVWIAIVRSRRARSSPFNIYLLALMLPDWFYNFNFSITSTMNAINGEYWSYQMCAWQSWYSVWGIGANAWLNGLMAWEILRMLRSSHQMRRYQPPTRKQVLFNGAVVYLFIGIFSALGSVRFVDSFYSLDTAVHGSLTCGPKPFNQNQTLIVWLFFAPLFVLIPYVYVLYCVLEIYFRKLLPARGKRRVLSIYFFRIVAVFLIMWGPVAFLIYFFNELVIADDKEHTSIFAVAIWAHFQAVLSASVTLTKPDILQAVKNFLCCREKEDLNKLPSEMTLRRPRQRDRPSWNISKQISYFMNGGVIRNNDEAEPSSMKGNNESMVIWSDIPVQSGVDFQFDDEKEEEKDEVEPDFSKKSIDMETPNTISVSE